MDPVVCFAADMIFFVFQNKQDREYIHKKVFKGLRL